MGNYYLEITYLLIIFSVPTSLSAPSIVSAPPSLPSSSAVVVEVHRSDAWEHPLSQDRGGVARKRERAITSRAADQPLGRRRGAFRCWCYHHSHGTKLHHKLTGEGGPNVRIDGLPMYIGQEFRNFYFFYVASLHFFSHPPVSSIGMSGTPVRPPSSRQSSVGVSLK